MSGHALTKQSQQLYKRRLVAWRKRSVLEEETGAWRKKIPLIIQKPLLLVKKSRVEVAHVPI
ncbi:hypothetical protein A9F13_04g02695 [Clavispora lusitaniae]|uniref:Uncharacterized protein n=1 Tax=Clavispora lusitaniae TaxID=36911 RepID=A0AA91T336_CLALS|nr:hypothetical protein A9F13_04g02695 [Clavispora lusitaniae]